MGIVSSRRRDRKNEDEVRSVWAFREKKRRIYMFVASISTVCTLDLGLLFRFLAVLGLYTAG